MAIPMPLQENCPVFPSRVLYPSTAHPFRKHLGPDYLQGLHKSFHMKGMDAHRGRAKAKKKGERKEEGEKKGKHKEAGSRGIPGRPENTYLQKQRPSEKNARKCLSVRRWRKLGNSIIFKEKSQLPRP